MEPAAMPIESAVVVTAIVVAFTVFGIVLAWVNHTTGARMHDGTPAE